MIIQLHPDISGNLHIKFWKNDANYIVVPAKDVEGHTPLITLDVDDDSKEKLTAWLNSK